MLAQQLLQLVFRQQAATSVSAACTMYTVHTAAAVVSQCSLSHSYWLASPDALEVIVVSYSLTHLLDVRTDLTDVTLVSDDTY